MFTNINLLRLKINRFIYGTSKTSSSSDLQPKQLIYEVVQKDPDLDNKYSACDEIYESDFVFCFNDEVHLMRIKGFKMIDLKACDCHRIKI